MSNLEKLVRYILLNYPEINELSKPRLVKLIYLIDWKYTIENSKQYTNIKWYFNHYGPYVNDVIDLMKSHSDVFEVISYNNSYEGVTDKFTLKDKSKIELENNIKTITDKFIDYTYKQTWSDFINLIYSSYPIKNTWKYNELNLEILAIEFNKNIR